MSDDPPSENRDPIPASPFAFRAEAPKASVPPPPRRPFWEREPGETPLWLLATLRIGMTLALVGAVTAALLWNTMFANMPRLPSADALWEMNREPSVQFVDPNSFTIATRGPRYGEVVQLKDLPPHVVNAFIAVEDKRFLEHTGVDFGAIIRATMSNFTSGRTVSGASTITQQLVKNLVLSPDQTLRRKAQEAKLAMELEGKLSKQQILELYLNRIYFGARAYGIAAAARTYFAKAPKDLTVAESAMLASFPKAPSRFASAAASKQARARQLYAIDQMVEAGYIDASTAAAAKAQPLTFAEDKEDDFTGHALDYAYEQIHELLPNPPPDLIVQLTLDPRMQKAAQDAVEKTLSELGKSRNASEGAAILMDTDGAIKAMVGGRDYKKSKFNRAAQARRQPGSSFKMFVYAAALEAGLTPGTIRFDEPISIGNWRPRNYYSNGYRGAVTLSEALAESLNTVAASVGVEVGVEKVTSLAREFGIRTELHNYPSVTLGSDVVTLLDMTTAYGVLARQGKQMSPYIVTEIRNSRRKVLYRRPPIEPVQIYPEDLAKEMTGMLSRVVVQGTGTAARVPGWDVAGKTGTSQEWRDAWFIGYTAKYVGGVWAGNDNDTPMAKVTGGAVPSVIFSRMMTAALEGVEPVPLPGAGQPEDFLGNEEIARLNFYRRLSSAFRQVANRAPG